MSTNFTNVTCVICCAMYLYQSSRFFIPIGFDVCFGGKMKCPEGVYIYIYIYIYICVYTVKIFEIRTPKNCCFTLKFEESGSTIE